MPNPQKTPAPRARLAVAALLAAVFLITDQVSKGFILDLARRGAFPIPVAPGVVEFDFVANTGVSFGFAQGFGSAFVVLAVAIVIASAVYLARAEKVSWFEVAGLGMLAGGAIGNAIDRVVLGFVVDFIATTFIDFPVFNIADIGITAGVALAFVGFMWFSPAAHEDGSPASAAPAEARAEATAPDPEREG